MELGECGYVAFSDFSMPCYAATCLLLPLNRNVAQDATLRLMYVVSRFWGSGKLTGKQCELMREQLPHQLTFYPVPFWSSGNLSGNQILAYAMVTGYVSAAMPAPVPLIAANHLQGVPLSHPRDATLRASREFCPCLPAEQRNKSRPRSLLD